MPEENTYSDKTAGQTYNDNGDVTALYHNSNAKPYVTYTYNENFVWADRMHKDLRPKKRVKDLERMIQKMQPVITLKDFVLEFGWYK